MMRSPDKSAVTIALLALVVVLLEWIWLDWRLGMKIADLRGDVEFLQEELAAQQRILVKQHQRCLIDGGCIVGEFLCKFLLNLAHIGDHIIVSQVAHI